MSFFLEKLSNFIEANGHLSRQNLTADSRSLTVDQRQGRSLNG
ncbi:hypothetical protein [Planktothricoides raciborskii]|nr:hypothetical protein [Planktothricoides raciborskii]